MKERSQLKESALSFISLAVVEGDLSSAKKFALVFTLLGKSLIQISKRSAPKIKPLGTPAGTGFHDEVCPFKTTL